jgi:hypothetical protein
MNKIVGLLIVVGLVAAAYTYRDTIGDKITALRGGTTEETTVADEPPAEVAPPKPDLTPHPALESQAEAKRIYPGVWIPGSQMNKKFLALYAEAKTNEPALLTRPDWPMTLADRTMVAMGGVPMSRTTPVHITPKPLPGSALDKRPSPAK